MKMNPTEKERRKAATKLRDAAYRNRRGAYEKAMDEALSTPELTKLRAERDAAGEKRDEQLRARDAEIQELERQINALKAQQKEVQDKYSPILDQCREAHSAASKAYRTQEAEIRAKVVAEFSDVSELWSGAASWKPIDEFLDQVPE